MQVDSLELLNSQTNLSEANITSKEEITQSIIDPTPDNILTISHHEGDMLKLGNQSQDFVTHNGIFSLSIVREAKARDLEFIPFGEGYEKYLDEILFKKKTHKTCSQISVFNYRDDGEITVSCENSDLPLVYESPANPDEKFANSGMKFDITRRNHGYVVNNISEYIYAQCKPREGNVILRNRFKSNIAEERANRTRDLIREYNKTDEFKPLTVVVLVLDSVSRQNFFKNMQSTVNFFNAKLVNASSELSKHFVIYDFLINHSVEPFTVPNMVPILYGKSKETIESLLASASIDKPKDLHLFLELQQNYSVWEYYKNKGFVTMILYDSVSDYLSKITGRKFTADHSAFNFWNLAKQYFLYSDFENKDICIGRHMPHVYSLKYLSEYLKNYKGYNRFSYMHINTAHELSGVRISHADKDFAVFFEDILQFYSKINEDIVFLFMSDHGASSGDFVTLQSFPERLSSFSFLISNKDYVQKHEFQNNLMINVQRLSSRYDWHKTLRHLAITPYKVLTLDDAEYQDTNTVPQSVSLLLETVPYSRTCEDAGINQIFCLSTKILEDVGTNNWENRTNLKYFVQQSMVLINRHLISKISTNCKSLLLDTVERIQRLYYDPSNEYEVTHYFIELTIKDNLKARFLIHGTSGYQNKYIRLKEKDEFMDHKRIFLRKNSQKVSEYVIDKIWSISRIDVYYNQTIDNLHCENTATFSFNLIKANPGENCREKCKARKLLCAATRFQSIITDYLQSSGMNSTYSGRESSIELQDNQVIVGSEDMCSETPTSNTTRLCNCVKV